MPQKVDRSPHQPWKVRARLATPGLYLMPPPREVGNQMPAHKSRSPGDENSHVSHPSDGVESTSLSSDSSFRVALFRVLTSTPP